MKYIYSLIIIVLLLTSCNKKSEESTTDVKEEPLTSYLQVSQRFLKNAEAGKSNGELVRLLADASIDSLDKELYDDNSKKAFWVNTYNGFIQHTLSKDSTQYHERSDFFKVKQFVVAGDSLSFDDVEHGIIRSSVVKWGLGYVPKIFPGKFERTLRTDEVDPRIHFLLNCGAQSCPPVYTFSAKNFDAEADKVAKDYLASVSEYDAQANLLKTSPLIKWFRGDFGEKDNDLLPIFYKYSIVPAGKNPKIEYGDYDWSLRLGNFY